MSAYADLCLRAVGCFVVAGVAGGNAIISRHLPTKDPVLPLALIFLRRDRARSDGNSNHGDPKLVNLVELEIHIRMSANDGATLEAQVHTEVENAIDALLTSPDFLARPVEGVESVDVVVTPVDAERPTVDAAIIIAVQWRSHYHPTFTTDFDRAAVRDGAGSPLADIGVETDA